MFFCKNFCCFVFSSYLCTAFEAQMAESVDALVSNTSGATRAGSTPALGTKVPLVAIMTHWSQAKAGCCKFRLTAPFLFIYKRTMAPL